MTFLDRKTLFVDYRLNYKERYHTRAADVLTDLIKKQALHTLPHDRLVLAGLTLIGTGALGSHGLASVGAVAQGIGTGTGPTL